MRVPSRQQKTLTVHAEFQVSQLRQFFVSLTGVLFKCCHAGHKSYSVPLALNIISQSVVPKPILARWKWNAEFALLAIKNLNLKPLVGRPPHGEVSPFSASQRFIFSRIRFSIKHYTIGMCLCACGTSSTETTCGCADCISKIVSRQPFY